MERMCHWPRCTNVARVETECFAYCSAHYGKVTRLRAALIALGKARKANPKVPIEKFLPALSHRDAWTEGMAKGFRTTALTGE